jgi:predicted porin
MKYISVTALIVGIGAIVVSQPVFAANVTVYGVAHGSVDSSDDGVNSSTYIASNSSRLGFSGGNDMGNGLSAIYQYESGLDLTGSGTNDGNGGPANAAGQLLTGTRDAFVGVSGDFGAVKMGRVGGLNQWVYDVNYFGDQVGDLGNLWGTAGLPGRVSNTISYDTPDMSGVTGTLVYSPEEGGTDTDTTVLKVNYAMNALKLGLGYLSVGNGNTNDQTSTALTGSYDFGAFNVGAGIQNDSDIGGVTGADSDSVTVGASAKVGDNGVAKLQVTSVDPEGNNNDATQFAIGYDHAVTNSATVYVAYASTDNDAGATYPATNYGHGDNVGVNAAGQDPSSISIGFVYKFNADIP